MFYKLAPYKLELLIMQLSNPSFLNIYNSFKQFNILIQFAEDIYYFSVLSIFVNKIYSFNYFLIIISFFNLFETYYKNVIS
jgi:hypothetical protein